MADRIRHRDDRVQGHVGRRAWLAGPLAVLVGAGLMLSAAPSRGADDTIRIGVFGPQTGAASRWGSFAWRGATLGTRQINAAGGVLGKKIELFQGDSQCVPAEGVSAVQRMINRDKVQIPVVDIS